jgi:glycosyltransferase involved in cell wall biosynthesis
MTPEKRCILFLDTGHKYRMEDLYGQKLRLLSKRFCGCVVTFGEAGTFEFGDFVVHSFKPLKSKPAIFARALFYCLAMVRRQRQAGRPFDLVVTYDPLNTGLLGAFVARFAGIPLVVEMNGDFTAWSNYSEVKSRRLRALKRWLYLRVATYVLRRASGVKLLCSGQLDYFRGRLRSGAAVRTFPNFLDLAGFRNLGETKKVVIIGFPFHVKGIDIAIAAFRQIAANHPEWSLEVLGWYRGEEKARLDASIDGHPQITHHPPIWKADMGGYVGKCGVLVCASRTEGFPRVVKEAMHAGKPCIVSDVGGLPDAIEHGTNGLIFRSEDVGGLAKQLDTLLASESLRARLGVAAREFAEHEYSPEVFLDYFHSLVQEVLH